VEIHRSARRHGINDQDIRHAIEHRVVVADIDPDADPPKLLAVGPDRAGNLLEVVVLTLSDGRLLVIHAMRLRSKYRGLLPGHSDD
jgi:hypothetical protein